VDHEDEDRERLLALPGKVAEDFNWRCYAFVLKGNHYHLMVETPEATLSRGMPQLNGVYTLGFNRRHGKGGASLPGALQGDPGGAGVASPRADPVRGAQPGWVRLFSDGVA